MQKHNLKIFSGLDNNFIQEILKFGKIVNMKKRNMPFSNGELEHYFYIVLKGKLKTYQINFENSKEQTIFIYRQGDMFDTIILLDNKPHDILYEVLEDTELLELPINKVREWIRTNQDFNSYFFPYIASQMRHTEELATDLSLYNTAQRLSKILLQNIDPNNKHYFKLLQNLSKTEIAKLLGTVRHVVERHLKELEKDNTIEKSRKKIYIKDVNKLLQKTETLLLN